MSQFQTSSLTNWGVFSNYFIYWQGDPKLVFTRAEIIA